MEIVIKPHHFMDIIKLYGAGIEVFVPAENMGHDFYKVGNMILGDHSVTLSLTVSGDDICMPCVMYKDHECVDHLEGIPDFTQKEIYNQALDNRLIKELKLDREKIYGAEELCSIMLEHHECIYSVWHEEDNFLTKKRHKLFVAGAQKYLSESWKAGYSLSIVKTL